MTSCVVPNAVLTPPFLFRTRRPPMYSLELGKSVIAALPHAVLLNLGFSVWVLSDDRVIQSSYLPINSNG